MLQMSDVTFSIPCCTLWNSFVQNVRLSNDDMLEDCTEAKCQKFAHVQFMAQELQLSMHTLPDYKDATFQYDFTVTPAELSNLFAHALIGRHFAASQNDDIKQHAFLSFNSMTQRADVIRPLCSFERTIYLVIVVLTILVLVSVIVVQLLRRNAKEREEQSTVQVSVEKSTSESIRKRF